MKQVGDRVEDLLGVDTDGKEIRLSDYKGLHIALYFYPKDNTAGCTAQACNLRDRYQDLLDAGFQVIGVSVDSMSSHQKFRDKYKFPFPLISDTDHHLVEEFGVWGEKSMCGRKYFGTMRTTFIINPHGVIEHIIAPKQVKTKIHADQILEIKRS